MFRQPKLWTSSMSEPGIWLKSIEICFSRTSQRQKIPQVRGACGGLLFHRHVAGPQLGSFTSTYARTDEIDPFALQREDTSIALQALARQQGQKLAEYQVGLPP